MEDFQESEDTDMRVGIEAKLKECQGGIVGIVVPRVRNRDWYEAFWLMWRTASRVAGLVPRDNTRVFLTEQQKRIK